MPTRNKIALSINNCHISFPLLRRQKREGELHLPRCILCKGERHSLRDNYYEYGVVITSRFVSQIARRQRRSVSLLRKIHRAWRARTFTLRREQLGTRATLPRFPSPSSSSFSSSFLLLPSRGRSTNPGSSVIPRALSGSRTCLASGDSLIRSTHFAEPASPVRLAEEARYSAAASLQVWLYLHYIYIQEVSCSNRISGLY